MASNTCNLNSTPADQTVLQKLKEQKKKAIYNDGPRLKTNTPKLYTKVSWMTSHGLRTKKRRSMRKSRGKRIKNLGFIGEKTSPTIFELTKAKHHPRNQDTNECARIKDAASLNVNTDTKYNDSSIKTDSN